MTDAPLPIIVPSVTALLPDAAGRVLVGGSHAGLYAAYCALRAGVRAAIHNNAGIGKEEAGIGGLAYAERHGMAMAAVDSFSARIGDGEDMMRRGVISHANALALAIGVAPGMACAEAAARLQAAPWPHAEPNPLDEARHIAREAGGAWHVVCLDSAALIDPSDRGAIVATGSHGGAPAGPATATIGAALVLFNDAGLGIERAGVAGLAFLEAAGRPAAAVAAMSARIGDGESTLRDGIVSDANRAAERIGVRIGEPVLDLVRRLTESPRA